MPIATGTRLGQYEVQDFIGQGAMGLVYRAYHSQLERIGAIKVIQAISPDANTVARFRHEAQAIAKMRHPNIVDVYDFGEYEGTPYMIVEYVPGGSLSDRMAKGMLDQASALKYLRGVATGLDYAHSHGVVHRDVKPANVLLTADDTPVLADFGLAKLLQGSSVKSMTGVTTGTPAYMSPEQVTGSNVGPASDRYSLATIAYEMLTGVIPFDGEGLMEMLYAHVHREPALPSSRDPKLSPRVDAVIMRGLAKDPAARWESCAAFVDALAVALATPARAAVERTVVMSPLRSTVPVAGVAVDSPRVAYPSPPPTVAWPQPVTPAPAPAAKVAAPKNRRHLWRKVAIGAAGLIVLVLALGVCLSLLATTITLSPSTATPGQDVHVTASRVPAHQPGSIQMHSAVKVFSFVADGNGNVSVYITVPRDIDLGSHEVDVCWNASCHAHATLQVVAGVVTTPAGNVTPNPPPTASATVSPHATPSAAGTPAGTPKPSQSPPVISVTNFDIKILTGTETVGGLHYTPGSTITVSFKQQGLPGTVVGTATVSSSGYWTLTFTVPKTAVLGYAEITACGTANGCLTQTVRVVT